MYQDEIGMAVISLLVVFVGWLFFQVRALKASAIEEVETRTPEQWHWLWQDFARTFVKAAYMLYPPERTSEMLSYVQDNMWLQASNYGFVVDEMFKAKIRAIIEAAVYDFYKEMTPPALPAPDTPDHK